MAAHLARTHTFPRAPLTPRPHTLLLALTALLAISTALTGCTVAAAHQPATAASLATPNAIAADPCPEPVSKIRARPSHAATPTPAPTTGPDLDRLPPVANCDLARFALSLTPGASDGRGGSRYVTQEGFYTVPGAPLMRVQTRMLLRNDGFALREERTLDVPPGPIVFTPADYTNARLAHADGPAHNSIDPIPTTADDLYTALCDLSPDGKITPIFALATVRDIGARQMPILAQRKAAILFLSSFDVISTHFGTRDPLNRPGVTVTLPLPDVDFSLTFDDTTGELLSETETLVTTIDRIRKRTGIRSTVVYTDRLRTEERTLQQIYLPT